MNTRHFLVHALSPLHAGTGHAADVIDLPTARMKATGISGRDDGAQNPAGGAPD
jgi:hypothetical protein